MKTFHHTNRNFGSGPHLIAICLLLAACFAWCSPLLFAEVDMTYRTALAGTIALVAGLAILTTYRGTQIRLEEMKIRAYQSVCGYKVGDWQGLSPVASVAVVPVHSRSTNTPNGISPTLSGSITTYQLLLTTQGGDPKYTFEYNSEKKARHNAQLLATRLNAHLAESFI